MRFVLIPLCLFLPRQSTPSQDLKSQIERLKSENIEEREQAYRALLAMGREVKPRLEEALGTAKDAELQARLRSLIKQLTVTRLAPILDRVRLAAKTDDWQRQGWRDLALEELLNELIARVGQVSKSPDLKLPTAFDEVRANTDPGAFALKEGRGLRIMRSGSIPFMKKSIVLVDGSISVSNAEECVIVATVAAEVSHSKRNVVIAGHFVEISHDGTQGGDASSQGSLLVSGSVGSISFSYGTLCLAPDRLVIAHADKTVSINSGSVEISHRQNTRDMRSEEIDFGQASRRNPLDGKIEITQSIGGSFGAVLFRTSDGSGEYVARLGAPLRGPKGEPLQELEGWNVSFLTHSYALFTKDAQSAGFLRLGKSFVSLPVREYRSR